jgi:hypothetical protein
LIYFDKVKIYGSALLVLPEPMLKNDLPPIAFPSALLVQNRLLIAGQS